jgi:hypothetical protein
MIVTNTLKCQKKHSAKQQDVLTKWLARVTKND